MTASVLKQAPNTKQFTLCVSVKIKRRSFGFDLLIIIAFHLKKKKKKKQQQLLDGSCQVQAGWPISDIATVIWYGTSYHLTTSWLEAATRSACLSRLVNLLLLPLVAC